MIFRLRHPAKSTPRATRAKIRPKHDTSEWALACLFYPSLMCRSVDVQQCSLRLGRVFVPFGLAERKPEAVWAQDSKHQQQPGHVFLCLSLSCRFALAWSVEVKSWTTPQGFPKPACIGTIRGCTSCADLKQQEQRNSSLRNSDQLLRCLGIYPLVRMLVKNAILLLRPRDYLSLHHSTVMRAGCYGKRLA